MSDFLFLYFMFGLAHWASHVLLCKSCKVNFLGFFDLVLQLIISTFARPIAAYSYASNAWQTKAKQTPENSLYIKLKTGENAEQFFDRIKEEALEHIRKMNANR